MKAILLCLLLGLTLSYNPSAAISYARTYCYNYNRNYNNYKGQGGDCANFVSQCLKAGGFSFDGCAGKDSKGMLINCSNLRACLEQKGWKHSTGVPNGFRGGYPFFNGYSHAMISTSVSGKTVTFCGHTNDRCDATLNNQGYVYYYL